MGSKVGKPAAKQGDRVVGVDTHIVMIPSPGGPVPTPVPAKGSDEKKKQKALDDADVALTEAKKVEGDAKTAAAM